MTATTAKQERNSRFRTGTVVCRICGKMTRETGRGEDNLELCAPCIDLSETENGIGDNGLKYYDAVAFRVALDACRERCRQNGKTLYEPMAHVMHQLLEWEGR